MWCPLQSPHLLLPLWWAAANPGTPSMCLGHPSRPWARDPLKQPHPVKRCSSSGSWRAVRKIRVKVGGGPFEDNLAGWSDSTPSRPPGPRAAMPRPHLARSGAWAHQERKSVVCH